MGASLRKKEFCMAACAIKKKKDVPRQAEVAQGVPGMLRPRIFLTFRHYKGGRLSAKCTGRLYPRRNPWYSLSEAELTSGHMVLSGVPWKKSPVTPPGIDPGTRNRPPPTTYLTIGPTSPRVQLTSCINTTAPACSCHTLHFSL